ncbi:MAG: CehA/McbA family metallohydrolase [Anaerolineae bacterium]|nr:CehA/McbA family metallohydrolase [Anaerolineae bacterium]MDW8068703.1 CehA/McbA family metallohydrolase [Anaerolineae bacterium]
MRIPRDGVKQGRLDNARTIGYHSARMRYYEIVGNLHVHTVYSDGTACHREIARVAAQAGLDFVITTDHNVWVRGVEGYTDGALLLVGEEVHWVRRYPPVNHLLIYGAEAELAPFAADPQRLIREAADRGGLCFLAHPYERGSPISPDLEPIPWVDWDVEGYTGLEIWNGMSEFKGLLWSRLAALFYALFPELGIRGPFRATLRQWDALLREGRRVAAIGGSDAHGHTYRLGPLHRVVFPYETLFRWVNTHVLVEQPLTGDLEADRRLIYGALRAGRTWVGYDRLASTRGFRFHVRSGSAVATMGEEIQRAGALVFEVETPRPGTIRLLRNGRGVARAWGRTLRFTTAEPGAYRVEVWRTFRGRPRGWIFSSPIYCR